jgi:hypothetical protein
MTAILPIGYLTILEAAEVLLPAMYAGVPDLPGVTSRLASETSRLTYGLPFVKRRAADPVLAAYIGPRRQAAKSQPFRELPRLHVRPSQVMHSPFFEEFSGLSSSPHACVASFLFCRRGSISGGDVGEFFSG